MALWDKQGTKPKHLSAAEKRNVIATSQGWVRRINYTDVHSNARQKDEILVAISDLGDLASMGNPTISSILVANSTGGTTLVSGDTFTLKIVYDEPVAFAAGNTNLTIEVANTVGAQGVTANSTGTISGANNTLEFLFTANSGTFKVEAQTIGNTAVANVYSLNDGAETANLIISAAVSNAYSTFVIS